MLAGVMNTEQQSLDYRRVALAIEFLRSRALEQPDLSAVATHIGLGAHHFQRLFTQWAGVSPKRFLQFLTIEDAKRRLALSRNTLDLADGVGLSGGGRLHDLFVTLEALTPGEARSGGRGLSINWGVHDTPFGHAMIGVTGRGICALHFIDDLEAAESLLRQSWPHAQLRHEPGLTAQTMQRVFKPMANQPRQPLAVVVKGTNFQVRVWQALMTLPEGTLATYGDIADALEMPGAARAVGSAIAANNIAWLIPCHRVIRSSGIITGYRWGSVRKAAMLGWEASQSP